LKDSRSSILPLFLSIHIFYLLHTTNIFLVYLVFSRYVIDISICCEKKERKEKKEKKEKEKKKKVEKKREEKKRRGEEKKRREKKKKKENK
jgi:hypothetical protein